METTEDHVDMEPLLGGTPPKRSPIRRRRSLPMPCGLQRQSKYLHLSILVTIFFIMIFVFFVCPEDICGKPVKLSRALSLKPKPEPLPRPLAKAPSIDDNVSVNFISYDAMQQDSFQFDINSTTDIMVFLHIQKTGGTTFGKHLVKDIDLENPCSCRRRKKKRKKLPSNAILPLLTRVKRKNLSCECFRPNSHRTWLFSRYSTGWQCGLHADWTELTECVDDYLDAKEGVVDNRRHFYITFLREPVNRFMSEFYHIKRGATWQEAQNSCNGEPATTSEIPPCYKGEDWMDADLDEFIECKSNLARNRQTKMLANLRLVNCYNTTGMRPVERERVMLESAKQNLKNMAYFGLTEMQLESQSLFEDTFSLQFKTRFEQHDPLSNYEDELDSQTLAQVKQVNSLDIELYAFAKKLMLERLRDLKQTS